MDDSKEKGSSPVDLGCDTGADSLLLSTAEAAKLLGVSVRFLEVSRMRGNGPRFCRLSRRIVRYQRADLEDWVEQQIKTSTSQD